MNQHFLSAGVQESASPHSFWRWLAAHKLAVVLMLAVVARLTVLIVLYPSLFGFELTGAVHGSGTFDIYASNLVSTGVYGITPGVPDAKLPPLYPHVLSGLYALFGRGGLQVGLFHTALDLITIVLLYHIGRRVLPARLAEWSALLAALFTALYPYLIFQNLTLIDTPLFMTLLYGWLYTLVLLRARERIDRGTWAIAALGGLLLGLTTLVRPVTPLLALLVALWFCFRLSFAQTVLRLLPVAVIGVLVVIPWVVRNEGVYQAFVPVSLTGGANLYQGNNPDVIPFLRAGYDTQWTGPDALRADPHTPEADRELTALALDWLRGNTALIPELLWVKFWTHWSIDVFPRVNPTEGSAPRPDYQGDAERQTDAAGNLELGNLPPGDPVALYSSSLFDQIGRMIHRWYFGALFFLALAGLVLTARHWRDVSLLWFVQFSMTFVYVLFHPSTRYRVPTDPLLFLLSAAALVWLWGRIKGWRTKSPV